MSIRDIMNESGYSITELNAKYGIPVRTLQNWYYGMRKPPEWLLVILSDLIILERMVNKHE